MLTSRARTSESVFRGKRKEERSRVRFGKRGVIGCLMALFSCSCGERADDIRQREQAAEPDALSPVSEELKKWHRVTLDFQGPSHQESDSDPNPFLDYRLQVEFTAPNGEVTVVPGFYAGDGNGGGDGDVWRVHFTPDQEGEWSYEASFRAGSEVAVALSPNAGSPVSFNGESGSFDVADLDDSAPGFRKYGRLESVDDYYFKFRDGGYWVKLGMNNPENLLGYDGFDNTPHAWHSYSNHVQDWNSGDPDWDSPDRAGSRDGRGIIGALNYIAETGLNSIYFMPMNIGADGMDVWPFSSEDIDREGSSSNDNLHYDVSKLTQWDIALTHAQNKEIFLHFVLGDKTRANKRELDNATLGTERRLFYRELIARFGHHNALQWNISEEFNLDYPLSANTIKEFAQYILDVDPYDHPISVHPHGNTYASALAPFMGDERIEVLSVQTWQEPDSVGSVVEYFRDRTTSAGNPIPTNIDEAIGMNQISPDEYRKRLIWDVVLSGGGFEMFKSFGDSEVDDFRVYEDHLEYGAIARAFMNTIPFWEMSPDDELVSGEDSLYGGAEVFKKEGELYVVYFPDASGSPTLDLSGESQNFSLEWFNPRTGSYQGGTTTVTPSDDVSLDPPTQSSQDWVAVLSATGSSNTRPVAEELAVSTDTNSPLDLVLSYSDPDGPGPYSFELRSGPSHGALSSISSGGVATYSPNVDFAGVDSFVYRVFDGTSYSLDATVYIQVGGTSLLLFDDFDRADSDQPGNGWVTFGGGDVGILDGRLTFLETGDRALAPMVQKSFSGSASGDVIEWSYYFDWERTGSEGTYFLHMQLGDSSLMDEDDPESGVGVHLVWGELDGHETLASRANGTDDELAEVSGGAVVSVRADLSSSTYDVFVDGTQVGSSLEFEEDVVPNTVRFFTDRLNHRHFGDMAFDDVQVAKYASEPNLRPSAYDMSEGTSSGESLEILLAADDPEGDSLSYTIVEPPRYGTLGSLDGDERVTYTSLAGYTGADSFTFQVSDGNLDSSVATVAIDVESGLSADLVVSPESFDLTLVEGEERSFVLSLSSVDDSSAAVETVSSNKAWLVPMAQSASVPGNFSVTANASGLTPGVYSGAVSFSSRELGFVSVDVLMTVLDGTENGSLMLSGSPDRTSPVPLGGATVSGGIYVFSLPETGVDSVEFFIDATPVMYDESAPFDLGGSDGDLALPYDTTVLSPGSHNLSVIIEYADGSMETVNDDFNVENSEASFQLVPSMVDETLSPGAVTTVTIDLTASQGDLPVDFDLIADQPFLTVETMVEEGSAEISMTLDATGLGEGDYQAALVASGTGFSDSSLPVMLRVEDPDEIPDGPNLLVSLSEDRSSPLLLDGATLDGRIYVFVGPEEGIDVVTFYLDTPTSGEPKRVEKNAPFDMQGGAPDVAYYVHTDNLGPGEHYVHAVLETSSGTQTLTAYFWVEE